MERQRTELEAILDAARDHLALVRDKDIHDRAVDDIKKRYIAYEKRRDEITRDNERPPKQRQTHGDTEKVRRDMYDDLEHIVTGAEEQQRKRIVQERENQAKLTAKKVRDYIDRQKDDGRSR